MNIREKTEKKVFSYIEEHRMMEPGEQIVLGVSGGADSVCLLFLLLEYARKVPVKLAVVHINHGIRPDAGEDAAYVKALCEQYGLPFFLTNADVEKLAAQAHCSTEDMGRRLRYKAFEQAAGKLGGAKIAVAHNAGDNAETMLFHLFRGSGLKGLCGIAPVRKMWDADVTSATDALSDAAAGEISIIRPILCLERQEIEDYLTAREIPWRTDSTNGTDDYTRNRIRHHILPYAETELVTGAVGHMSRTAEMLAEVEEYLEQQTRAALEKCLVEKKKPFRFVLDCEAFTAQAPVLQKRILLSLAKELSPTGKDIAQVHIRDMLSLFSESGNRSVDLPFEIRARREYTKVVLERRYETGEGFRQTVPLEQILGGNPFVYSLGNDKKLEFSLIFHEKDRELPRNQYTKWFDCDKILECPVIRTRAVGDYFTIRDESGGSRHKSLKDYMIGEKIPKQERDELPLIAVGNHVMWLVGRRISEYFKVSGNTNRILQVKLIKMDCRSSETEEENGRTD